MTLLERISAPERAPSLGERLFAALRSVPHATGLAVGHYPSGTQGILVLDAAGDAFLDAEEAAMEGLLQVRREFANSAIDLICLSATDADRVDVPPDVQVYRFA